MTGRLSAQQRNVLIEADARQYVSARTFTNAYRSTNAASAVLRRLANRGLLARDEANSAIFRITESGRAALSGSR